jgi:hypothetical protein
MNAAEDGNVIHLPSNEPQPQPSHSSGQDPASSDNLEKVRDILFGAQMRDYDRRSVHLEEGLRKESADLREETRLRFDSLENYIKQEIAALTESVKAEMDDIRRKHEDLSSILSRETQRLSSDKLDRAALANLFTELANQLIKDPQPPAHEE